MDWATRVSKASIDWMDLIGPMGQGASRSAPMYAQLFDKFRQAIQSSQLLGETKLPPERDLAAMLKVDRSTISRAYLELENAGLVESHVGRGTFVRRTSKLAVMPDTGISLPAPSSMSWSNKFSRVSQIAYGIMARQSQATGDNQDLIHFGGALPSEEFYPFAELQRIVSDLAKGSRAAELFAYSPSEGHAGLKQEVAKYLQAQQIPVKDQELLIVSGSQQALDLVTSTLLDPGDLVLVEDPTYFWAICNFTMSQARCLPVAVDQDGLRVDVLESILRRHTPKLLYVMPTYQNPTGNSMSLPRRRQLLDLARRYQLPILEDNFVGDLRYEGQALPSLKALDAAGDTVIQQGTFSKALCPGLRLGWLIAPEVIMSRLRLAKRAADLSTNTMAQAVMAEYLKQNLYQKHLRVVTEAYRRRRDVLCTSLTKHLKQDLKWSVPQGGMFVWVELPAGYSARELLAYAEREGVAFSPGDMFFANGDRFEFFRLSFIQVDEQQIEEGISRLAKAVRKYKHSRQAQLTPSYKGSDPALL